MLNCESALDMFLDTKFRYVSNAVSTNDKTTRSTSAQSHTGLKGLTGGKDVADLLEYAAKEESSLLEHSKFKSTFRPLNQQYTESD